MKKILKRKSSIITILSLAIPVMFESIFQTLLGTTDVFFAGLIGDDAIAGTGITNMVMNIFITFYIAIGVGTTAIVARKFGEKNEEEVSKTIGQAFYLSIIIGLVIGLFTLIFTHPILNFAGASGSVLNYARPYYLFVAVPSVFLSLQLILSSCLRAIKNTKTPMYAIGFANLLNILLNILFLKLGFGMIGLGLATTLSRALSAFILIWQLKKTVAPHLLKKKNAKLDPPIIKSMLKIGAPAGVEKMIMRIGQLIYLSMILSIGLSSFVAHNIAGTIENFSYIPSMGFGIATATLVGISLGEKNRAKAKHYTLLSNVLSAICMSAIGLIFYWFAPQLAGLFTHTPDIQNLVITVLKLIAWFQIFSSITQVLTSALQGAGDTKFPMYTTFLGIWGIRIGIGYLLAYTLGLGLIGVWIAYAIDLVTRSILLSIRFIKGKWYKVKI